MLTNEQSDFSSSFNVNLANGFQEKLLNAKLLLVGLNILFVG